MKAAISIAKSEIKWHEKNRGTGPSEDWEDAFIAGLNHLLDLFIQAELLEEDSEDK